MSLKYSEKCRERKAEALREGEMLQGGPGCGEKGSMR
jgi:hypothetical protein